MRSMSSRRRRRVIAGAVAGVVVLLATVAAILLARWTPEALRARVVAELSREFDSTVEFAALRVSLYPRLRVEGEGLVLRHQGRTDVPPLIVVDRFSAQARWRSLVATPRRVDRVRLDGLRITVPPRPARRPDGEDGGCRGGTPDSAAEAARAEAPAVVVGEVVCTRARLDLLPRRADKQPRVFSIHDLTLRDVAPGRPMTFSARLTNPKPQGLIVTQGAFGPWHESAPSLTPVSGRFVFDGADLGTLRGIEGTLSSEGTYSGVLEAIRVRGSTETPDFSLATAGNPVPLDTRFVACVDGTDGDTYLDRVEARLGRTGIVASGRIEGKAGVAGRTIALDVTVEHGRIDDLLRLAVKGDEPFMSGGVSLQTTFLLPPGERDVIERLKLDGQFGVERSTFAAPTVQAKVDELSRRGRGDVEDTTPDRALSDLRGRFALDDGTMQFSRLTFAVSGALVRLAGYYDLAGQTVDLRGTLRLRATLSETTTGLRSLLLKAVDPLFRRKDAGTVLPITITGSHDKPAFKVDVKRALARTDP